MAEQLATVPSHPDDWQDVCIMGKMHPGLSSVKLERVFAAFCDEDTLAKHTLILVEMQWKSLNIITS